jgi:hypothetical protein
MEQRTVREETRSARGGPHSIGTSLTKTARTFGQALPVIIGMLLLTSLALTLFSPEQFAHLFGRNDWLDALLGTALGSIAAGPPLASYLLGGELRAGGVSLLAVTALVVSWVTVGVVQLPAEALFLGRRFALARNLVAFVFTLAVAWLSVQTLRVFGAVLP